MTGKDGDKTLRRIIWMLLSLSLLAERASSACWPVRCLVLWILRPAEAVACGFVQELTQAPLGFIDLSDLPDDNSPAAALCLAMRFTALAAALQYLLDQAQPFEENALQAHAAAGVRPVVRRLNSRSPIGLPGSRAPPSLPRKTDTQDSTAKTATWSVSARPAIAARAIPAYSFGHAFMWRQWPRPSTPPNTDSARTA